MKLFNCIITGLVVGILSTWIFAIYLASQPPGGIGIFGAFLLIFGKMIGPIMLAVFLFVVVKKHIAPRHRLVSYLAQTGIVCAIMVVGACLMTIAESVTMEGRAGLSWASLFYYSDRYFQFVPVLLLDCLTIAPVYYGVSKFTSAL